MNNKVHQFTKLLEKRADSNSPYGYMLGYIEGMLQCMIIENKQLEESIDKEIARLKKDLDLSTNNL